MLIIPCCAANIQVGIYKNGCQLSELLAELPQAVNKMFNQRVITRRNGEAITIFISMNNGSIFLTGNFGIRSVRVTTKQTV